MISTVDLHVLTSSDQLFQILRVVFFFSLTNRAVLIRRSTVLSFPLQKRVPWAYINSHNALTKKIQQTRGAFLEKRLGGVRWWFKYLRFDPRDQVGTRGQLRSGTGRVGRDTPPPTKKLMLVKS
jgi:hypothetical protein